jgi:hypothetical protein
MGWITDRKGQTGGSIGPGGLRASKKGAPLRKVVRVIVAQESIFSQARVEFECGHEGRCWGGIRGRCVKCKDEAARELSQEPKEEKT